MDGTAENQTRHDETVMNGTLKIAQIVLYCAAALITLGGLYDVFVPKLQSKLFVLTLQDWASFIVSAIIYQRHPLNWLAGVDKHSSEPHGEGYQTSPPRS